MKYAKEILFVAIILTAFGLFINYYIQIEPKNDVKATEEPWYENVTLDMTCEELKNSFHVLGFPFMADVQRNIEILQIMNLKGCQIK